MTPQHPPMAPAHYTGVIRGPHVNGIRAANKLGAHAPLNNYQQPILHQQNQYNPNGMNSYYLQANTHNSAIDPQFEARAQLMAFHNRERVPNHKLGLSRADHGYMQDGKFRFQHDNESGNSRTPIKDKLLREGSFHLDANMKGKNKNQYSNDDLAKKMRDKNWLLEKTNSSKQAETDPHDIFKDLNLEIQPTFGEIYELFTFIFFYLSFKSLYFCLKFFTELEKNLNANKKRISADGVKALDYINLDDLLNDHINLNEFLKHDDLVDNLIRDDEKI